MKVNLVCLVSVFSCFFVFTESSKAASSSQEIPYYGEEFYHDLAAGTANDDLIKTIQTVMRSFHNPKSGALDQISNSCAGTACYQHVSLGYDVARIFMMGVYYLVQDGNDYALPDVYCGVYRKASEFKTVPPGPHQIPDGTVLNTEHTWPQSKFTGRFDGNMQKSDLHHLFPTDSQMNAIRGNNHFGEVVKDSKILKCPVSRTGSSAKNHSEVFEPPTAHKGNAARAIFYFSVRYGMPIEAEEQETLRKWNIQDPVDEEELHRNDEIMKVQGNRNPFVDYPELVERIRKF